MIASTHCFLTEEPEFAVVRLLCIHPICTVFVTFIGLCVFCRLFLLEVKLRTFSKNFLGRQAVWNNPQALKEFRQPVKLFSDTSFPSFRVVPGHGHKWYSSW